MTQVKRFRHRSPPPRKIPALPAPIQFQPPKLFDDRPFTQKTGSDIDTSISNEKQNNSIQDPKLSVNVVEPSLISMYSSHSDLDSFEKQALSSEIDLPVQNNNITTESMSLLTMDDNFNGLLHKKHLPVFARFPFHVSLLSKPMESNIEDNVHRLRLRLIESEMDHQRLSAENYIKRTQKKLSISSPTTTENDLTNVRPPSLLVHQQVVPRILSRQTTVSILSVATPSSPRRMSRDRLGIENDILHNTDIERELEILQIEESLNKNHRLNQSVTLSNFSYDSHLRLQPLNEKHVYSTSNVDDLIDSMARRHLAYRRLDVAIDRQRRTNRYPDSIPTGRTTYRSPHRREDLGSTNRSMRNPTDRDYSRLSSNNFNQRLRSRIDYYNRIQPDPDSLGIDDSTYGNIYSKLPPISSGYESNHFTNLQPPLTPSFYDVKHDSHMHQHHQETIPLHLSNPVEHLMDLPSDIYLTTRPDTLDITQNHPQTSLNRRISLSKDNILNNTSYHSQTPIHRRISLSRDNILNTAPHYAQTSTNRRISVTRDNILNTFDHDQHLIKARPISVSKHHSLNHSHQSLQTPRIAPIPISKDCTYKINLELCRKVSIDVSIRKDRSNIENERPLIGRQYSSYERNANFAVNHHDIPSKPTMHEKKASKLRRNLLKKKAIGILFIITLKNLAIKKRSYLKDHKNQSTQALIHKIRLQEIIVALHRVYLEPDGAIHSALFSAINHPISLGNALDRSAKHYSEAIEIIGTTLKTVISKITEFMPKEGILGTEKSSAVSALIQDGNPFPESYFWQCEREQLEFNNSKVINITKHRAKLLLIGIFLFRALVTTLLLKPVKYRFILGHLTPNQSVSLKVLASVMLYVGRRGVGSKSQLLTLPHEWKLSLHTDADIETIIQHSDINSIINTCEQSLRMWCEEYIRRIDANFGKEFRM